MTRTKGLKTMITCPVCGGPGVQLGQLGQRMHFRCRNCGIDFSMDVNDLLDADLDEPCGCWNYTHLGRCIHTA